jgi:orotidine-5'-phosphate decarboxylase
MTRQQLFENIKNKKSFLCVGLDTDVNLIPKHLLNLDDPIFEFNKQIIDATKDLCVAYKPNIAFYEAQGYKGWQSLEKTINYINKTCDNIFTIADAKRGDIGNTSKMYAQAFFEKMNFDSITIAPYMGEDSVVPFFDYKNKWVILLALTSNKGASDFQFTKTLSPLGQNSEMVFQNVLEISKKWSTPENMMYVVGATKADMLTEIRKIVPDNFLLIPGIGAQGGSLQEVAKNGINKQCGLLVNSTRGIIYVSNKEDFADKARAEALLIKKEMEVLLDKYL